MKILFTRSNKLVSRLIRRVTGEPVSHCALSIGDYVVHSNFLGMHPQTLASFEDGIEVWGSVELPDNYERVFDKLCQNYRAWYDFGAMAYLLAKAIFPWLPKKNLWQCSGMFLCSEWVSDYMGEDDAMITPYKLYLKLGGVDKKVADA